MKFEELGFEDSLKEGLDAMNFSEMTPVQEKAIPVIMEGHDIIACAQTGTGKTAAFLLPVLNRMLKFPHDPDSVNAIVMSPTRELAQQIDQQLEGFSYFLPISSVAVYGGNDASAWEQQKRAMQLGADFVIATPGRLISHINLDNVDFSKVSYFILDEADRMLDMGFYDDILQIVSKLPKERQTIMFSATMPPKIKKLAETILRDPVSVDIAISKPADGIKQGAYVCYEAQKLSLARTLLHDKKEEKIIIFSSSKQTVKDLYRALRQKGLVAGEMHSDLEQADRDRVMLDFKSGKVNILVATDIVARGIDVDGIDMVINYDVPRDVEDYIHRIGRTARANREGAGLTFVSEKDQERFAKIERFLEKTIEKLPLPVELGEGPAYEPKASQRGNGGRGGRNGRKRPAQAKKAAPAGEGSEAKPNEQTAQGQRPKSKHRHRHGNQPNHTNPQNQQNRPEGENPNRSFVPKEPRQEGDAQPHQHRRRPHHRRRPGGNQNGAGNAEAPTKEN
ncbi:MAG: DEAD/DEAH box helicase [Paludibacteraceae bacterium]|nr:DEAD/DEAH box helicase [Paludibacteraceae bacterium]